MAWLSEEDKNEIKKMFERLENKVKVINFTQKHECQYCRETREILEELSQLSDKIELEVYEFLENEDLAKKYNVDKIPAIVLLRKENGEYRDYGVRFFGIPSGYEFASLLEGIIDVSRGKTDLHDDVVEIIKKVDKPVNIMVFVTPTCPYCPLAVRTAHKFAIENENITASMIEATEFPELSNRYSVFAVPKVVINDKVSFEGAIPEEAFAKKVIEAIK